MNPPPREVYIQIDDKTEATAFCLRRMETVIDTDCRLCFDGHEQLQAGYRSRIRCAALHWVEIAAFLPSSRVRRESSAPEERPSPAISHHPSKERRPRWT